MDSRHSTMRNRMSISSQMKQSSYSHNKEGAKKEEEMMFNSQRTKKVDTAVEIQKNGFELNGSSLFQRARKTVNDEKEFEDKKPLPIADLEEQQSKTLGAKAFSQIMNQKEKEDYVKEINRILQNDENCTNHIPLKETDNSLFNAFEDGILM